jgi:hypothetical protein
MHTTIADEVRLLRAAEFEAEQAYGEAARGADLAAVRSAVDKWGKAADALTEYLATHPHPYRYSG